METKYHLSHRENELERVNEMRTERGLGVKLSSQSEDVKQSQFPMSVLSEWIVPVGKDSHILRKVSDTLQLLPLCV